MFFTLFLYFLSIPWIILFVYFVIHIKENEYIIINFGKKTHRRNTSRDHNKILDNIINILTRISGDRFDLVEPVDLFSYHASSPSYSPRINTDVRRRRVRKEREPYNDERNPKCYLEEPVDFFSRDDTSSPTYSQRTDVRRRRVRKVRVKREPYNDENNTESVKKYDNEYMTNIANFLSTAAECVGKSGGVSNMMDLVRASISDKNDDESENSDEKTESIEVQNDEIKSKGKPSSSENIQNDGQPVDMKKFVSTFTDMMNSNGIASDVTSNIMNNVLSMNNIIEGRYDKYFEKDDDTGTKDQSNNVDVASPSTGTKRKRKRRKNIQDDELDEMMNTDAKADAEIEDKTE